MFEIKRATAVYSGGGIYLYYAELDDGNWLLGNDDWFIVVDANPIVDNETFEGSGYYEWQTQYLVKMIVEKDFQEVLNDVLKVIFKGDTIKEYDNFSVSELKTRLM